MSEARATHTTTDAPPPPEEMQISHSPIDDLAVATCKIDNNSITAQRTQVERLTERFYALGIQALDEPNCQWPDVLRAWANASKRLTLEALAQWEPE